MCSQTIPPFRNTTTTRLRPAAALRAAQARCFRLCYRTRSRSRLRRVRRRPCQARCPMVGCPPSRARAWITHRHALGQNQDGSGVEFEFGVPDSVHAQCPIRLFTPSPSLLPLFLGRAGAAGAEVGAVAKVDVDADTARRTSTGELFFRQNQGDVRAAPHRPVRSSRGAVLNTSCQKGDVRR